MGPHVDLHVLAPGELLVTGVAGEGPLAGVYSDVVDQLVLGL